MKSLLLFSLMGLAFSLNAQTLPAPILKFSPLTIFDPLSPTFQVGYEHFLKSNPNISLQGDIGVQLFGITKDLLDFGVDFPKFNYKVKTEGRYYFPKSYFAVELFYHYALFKKDSGSYINDQGKDMLFSQAKIHKNTYGTTFKFGWQREIGHRYITDFFIGFGFRIRNIMYRTTNETLDLEPKKSMEGSLLDFNDIMYQESNYPTVHFSLGFKIGFLLHEPQPVSLPKN